MVSLFWSCRVALCRMVAKYSLSNQRDDSDLPSRSCPRQRQRHGHATKQTLWYGRSVAISYKRAVYETGRGSSIAPSDCRIAPRRLPLFNVRSGVFVGVLARTISKYIYSYQRHNSRSPVHPVHPGPSSPSSPFQRTSAQHSAAPCSTLHAKELFLDR